MVTRLLILVLMVLSIACQAQSYSPSSQRVSKVVTVSNMDDFVWQTGDCFNILSNGARYCVESTLPAGIAMADGIGAITLTKNGTQYAIMQPLASNIYLGEWFNLDADGDHSNPAESTDNSPLIQAALDFIAPAAISGNNSQGQDIFLASTRGGLLLLSGGVYKTDTTLFVPSGVTLSGSAFINTQLMHRPSTAETNAIEVKDGAFHYASRYSSPNIENIQISGDVDATTGLGNSNIGIRYHGSTDIEVTNVQINRFNTAVVIAFDDGDQVAYYNKFTGCVFEHNKQLVYLDTLTAVTKFFDCRFVGTGKFGGVLNDYAIVSNSGVSFFGCSFEGSSWPKAHINAINGRFAIFGGREEGSDENRPVVHVNGRAVNSGVHMYPDNGPTGMLAQINGMDSPPDSSELNDDQTIIARPMNFGTGSPTKCNVIYNEDFVFGRNGWLDNGSFGSKFLETDGDSCFGSHAYKFVSNGEGANGLRQEFFAPAPDLYFTVWVRKSSDADIALQVSGVLSAQGTSGFKEFQEEKRMGDVGGWVLYYTRVAHYTGEQATNLSLNVGLKSNSPADSWAVFSNFEVTTGGYSPFPSIDMITPLVMRDTVTQGFPQVDRLVFNGGSLERCSFNLSTTATTAEIAASTEITLASTTGIQTGDFIGIMGDNSSWTTVSGVSGNDVTLNDGLDTASSIGDVVYVFRLENY